MTPALPCDPEQGSGELGMTYPPTVTRPLR